MSFMFKGPMALTGASTAASLAATGAISTTSTLAVTGTSTLAAVNASGLLAAAVNATVGGTLGVTGISTLAAVNVSGLLAAAAAVTVGTTLGVTGATTLSGTTSITNAVTFSGGSAALELGTKRITGVGDPSGDQDAATKAYVTAQIATVNGGTPVDVSSITGEVITQPAFSGTRHFFIDSTSHSGPGTMTLSLTSTTGVSSGDHWSFMWIAKQIAGTAGGIKIDLGSGKLLDANGTSNQYITLPNLGSSARLIYHGSLVWTIIGGSGFIPSNS